MNIFDLLDETRFSITASKARSALTVLGIVIGISSVIVMVSIGQGTRASIEKSIQSVGSNLLMVSPGFGRGGGAVRGAPGSNSTLTMDDAKAIAAQVTNIQAIDEQSSTEQQVVAGANNINTRIMGTTPTYASIHSLTMAQGSFFTQNDLDGSRKIAILGSTARDDLFGVNAQVVGKQMRIGSQVFVIIGVAASKGGTGFGSVDDMIWAPLTTVQQQLSGSSTLSLIDIQVNSAQNMTAVQAQVTTLLDQRHNVTNSQQADFNVLSQSDILASANSITGTLTLLLGSIAGISLLVGGIGIMNMMLTAVTERTREIGLRKALGAREYDITLQFLTESVALTLIGGLIGVALGFLISWGITASGVVTTSVSAVSVVLAVGVSALVGIVFGSYPARRAAMLSPIEALRYQ